MSIRKPLILGSAVNPTVATSVLHGSGSRIPNPSLDLDFIGRSTLDSRITFTRASSGTYFNSAMVMQTGGTNVPRFDHSLANGALGLLIEEARTNICLQSQTVDVNGSGTPWTHMRTSVSSNDVVAPDGTTTADKIVEDSTASNSHLITQIISFINTVQYTMSGFVRSDERTDVRLSFPNAAFPTNSNAEFNLATGTVRAEGAGADDSGIADIGGGWFHCWVIATADVTTSNTVAIWLMDGTSLSYNGDGSSGLHLWGAQVEVGAFPSSYIKTTTGTVTRAKDVATIPTDGWAHMGVGTVYVKGCVLAVGNSVTQYFTVEDDGAITDALRVLATDTVDAGALQTTNSAGNNGFSAAGTILARTPFKLAGTFIQDHVEAAVDGVSDATPDTTADIPLANPSTIMRFGTDSGGNKYLNGHIARFTFWPVQLSDGFLRMITS